MLPAQLTSIGFAKYPPLARAIAQKKLALFQQLPLIFEAILLRELIEYDWKFPAERVDLDDQLSYLSSLSSDERANVLAGLSAIKVSPELQNADWVDQPASFVAQLSAYLWATHQMDQFRQAADSYADKWHAARPRLAPKVGRLGMVVFGKQLAPPDDGSLYRKIKEHGVLFTNVDPTDGFNTLSGALASRAAQSPSDFAHWRITGGAAPLDSASGTAVVSYEDLAPVRQALLKRVDEGMRNGIAGPEQLRSFLMRLTAKDLGMQGPSEVLDRFQISLFTDGSGTQIFSTSFVQWASREALRRAQPLTLLAHYTPRQAQRSMNELLSPSGDVPTLDPAGSLVDADMAAYYTWINQQRLPGSDRGSFVVWLEGSRRAVALGPSLAKGTVSAAPATLSQILEWAS